jgi:hypothetical protein
MIDLLASGRSVEAGTGRILRQPDAVRLLRGGATAREYSDAEITNLAGWSPPLTLTVRARFSHPIDQIRGTAGFGFWNRALGPEILGIRPPRLAWFLAASPPYDVPVALGVPGRGLKAAVMDAQRPAFFALLPTAPIGFLMMRLPALHGRLWPIAQRALGVDEAFLGRIDPTEYHTYAFEWLPHRVCFSVDGNPVLTTRDAPVGPLRFVAWIDNAYAVATPQGRFGMGLLADPVERWLDIADLKIETQRGQDVPGGRAAL